MREEIRIKVGNLREVKCRPSKRQTPHAAFDQHGVLVVYKPPHWTMTTTAQMPRDKSIQAWVGDTFGRRYPFLREDPLQSGLIQRLDVQTSGPVVIATRRETFREMWRLRATGHFYKEYRALLHGALPLEHCCGMLDYSLDARRAGTEVCEYVGQPARTKYQAVAAFSRRESTDAEPAIRHYTLIRARILTGRTHQIRVHFRELARRLGFPVCGVVGDYKYLPWAEVLRDWAFCPRLFLHARILKFPLPEARGGFCCVSCVLPSDLGRVLRTLTPDRETTAKYCRLHDFLHGGEALTPSLRLGSSRKRRPWHNEESPSKRRRSRSPSHWKPCEGDVDPSPPPSLMRRRDSGRGSRSRARGSRSPSHWRPTSPPALKPQPAEEVLTTPVAEGAKTVPGSTPPKRPQARRRHEAGRSPSHWRPATKKAKHSLQVRLARRRPPERAESQSGARPKPGNDVSAPKSRPRQADVPKRASESSRPVSTEMRPRRGPSQASGLVTKVGVERALSPKPPHSTETSQVPKDKDPITPTPTLKLASRSGCRSPKVVKRTGPRESRGGSGTRDTSRRRVETPDLVAEEVRRRALEEAQRIIEDPVTPAPKMASRSSCSPKTVKRPVRRMSDTRRAVREARREVPDEDARRRAFDETQRIIEAWHWSAQESVPPADTVMNSVSSRVPSRERETVRQSESPETRPYRFCSVSKGGSAL